jgi:hypothetical protein
MAVVVQNSIPPQTAQPTFIGKRWLSLSLLGGAIVSNFIPIGCGGSPANADGRSAGGGGNQVNRSALSMRNVLLTSGTRVIAVSQPRHSCELIDARGARLTLSIIDFESEGRGLFVTVPGPFKVNMVHILPEQRVLLADFFKAFLERDAAVPLKLDSPTVTLANPIANIALKILQSGSSTDRSSALRILKDSTWNIEAPEYQKSGKFYQLDSYLNKQDNGVKLQRLPERKIPDKAHGSFIFEITVTKASQPEDRGAWLLTVQAGNRKELYVSLHRHEVQPAENDFHLLTSDLADRLRSELLATEEGEYRKACEFIQKEGVVELLAQ